MSKSIGLTNDPQPLAPAIPPLAISFGEWEIVSAILLRHLLGRTIWAYGSRARGSRLKRYSDLDLAIEGPLLSLAAMADLREDFDESPLTFKVDIVEAESLEAEFRQRIEADKVLLITP